MDKMSKRFLLYVGVYYSEQSSTKYLYSELKEEAKKNPDFEGWTDFEIELDELYFEENVDWTKDYKYLLKIYGKEGEKNND